MLSRVTTMEREWLRMRTCNDPRFGPRAWLAVATTTLVALTLGAAGPAHATFPGRNGKVAYVDSPRSTGNGDGRPQVFTMQKDGTHQQQVTFGGMNDNPAWAPHGHRILFRHWRHDGRTALKVMDAHGRHQRRVVGSRQGGFIISASWAPGGGRFVFVWQRRRAVDLYIYSFKSRKVTRVHADDGASRGPLEVAWSPDGSSIMFSAVVKTSQTAEVTTDLFTIHPDGTGLHQITATPNVFEDRPDWSPDGQRVVYDALGTGACEEYLVVSRPDGSEPNTIRAGCLISRPSWSPNGRRIMAYAVRNRGAGLWTMSPTGAHPHFIGAGGDADWQPVPNVPTAQPRRTK